MTARTSLPILLSCAVLMLVACPSAETPPAAPAVVTTPQPRIEDAPPTASPPTKAHFADAVAIQGGLIRGDLGVVGEAAKRLAAYPALGGLDVNGEVRVERIRSLAITALSASDLSTASASLAAIASECRACHAELDTPLVFDSPRRPGHDPEIKHHMARHAWTVDRLWEALITGSQERWTKGLSGLAEETIGPDHITGMDKLPPTAFAAAQRVHELAAEGLVASTIGERERIYADLITACGTCHALLGTGPGKGASAP
mgnify:CR=1 FL=1